MNDVIRRRSAAALAWGALALVTVLGLAGGTAFAQAPDWSSEAPPRPLAARDVRFPPFELKALANGMQVVVLPHHEQPVISARLIVRAGGAWDPRERQGVATLLAALLDQGTTSRTAQQIADTIDSIGGSLDTGAGSDLSFADIVVMKDSFELGMRLIADVVRHPALAPEEIERQRQQTVSALKVGYEDPDYIANVVFDRLVFGFNPYGLPHNGTPESIAKITREDLAAFHRRYFVPNNSILAIVGDTTAEEAYRAAERVFGDWPRREILADRFVDPPPPTRRVIVVDKPDAVQTEIRVGHLGVPRKHADYMALDLAFRILGGEGSNRLQRVLRTERGLTYQASADIETYQHSGSFVAGTNTRSEATGEVLRLMVDEVSRLQRERVGDQELENAKAYLAGSFPLTIETPDAIAMQVLNVLFYGLPLDELRTYRERVHAVRAEDIQRVARAYLKPDRLSVVLVGNAAAFREQLRGVGFGSFEVIPLAALDLAAADFRRSSATPASGGEAAPRGRLPGAAGTRAPATGEGSDATGARDIIARAVQAKGGLEKLRSIRTVVATATTVVTTPSGPMTADTRTYIEYPARFRVEAHLPTVQVVQTYSDGAAWLQDHMGVRDAPDPMREEFRASAQRDLIPLLVAATSGSLRMRTLPDAGGLRAVELSGSDLDPVELYIDPRSWLVSKQRYTTDGPAGRETAEESFSDYRSVDGLQVAFKATVRRGATVLERTLTAFNVNAPVDPGLFKKPPN